MSVKDCAAPNVKTSYTKPAAIFTVKSMLHCNHSPRWNRLYLADIGDATYSSSDTEESVAFRLYRLEEGGQESNHPLHSHGQLLYRRGNERQKRQKEKRDSSKNGVVGKKKL